MREAHCGTKAPVLHMRAAQTRPRLPDELVRALDVRFSDRLVHAVWTRSHCYRMPERRRVGCVGTSLVLGGCGTNRVSLWFDTTDVRRTGCAPHPDAYTAGTTDKTVALGRAARTSPLMMNKDANMKRPSAATGRMLTS